MAQKQFLDWLVPPVFAALLSAIYGLVRMWSRLDRIADEQARGLRDFAELRQRVDQHEGQLQEALQQLSAIVEGVEWIKRALTSAIDRRGGGV